MTRLITLAAALGILTSPARAQTDDNAAAEALAATECRALVHAFNAHDIPTLVSFYAPHADAVVLAGSSVQSLEFVRLRGQNEARGVYETFFEQFPKAHLDCVVKSARFLTPDILVTDQAYEITGLPSDAGPVRAVLFVVRQKIEGKWRVVCERHLAQTPVPHLSTTEKSSGR